jgi:hypothetical protein
MCHRTMTLAAAFAAACIVIEAGGCHRPQGAILSYTGGSYTYYSTETAPKTLRLVDLRSNQTVFSMDIPVGKQLTIDFVEGKGDDPVYTPDLMRYEVWDIGTTTGRLTNAMTVPNASSRHIEMSIRQGPEYMTAAPAEALRVDQMQDRPDWWTPEGGKMPEDTHGVENYDH